MLLTLFACAIDLPWNEPPTPEPKPQLVVTPPSVNTKPIKAGPILPDALLADDVCGQEVPALPVRDDGTTADLECGDNLVGGTVGGSQHFDTTFYAKKFCWPATVNHDGGDERIYRLPLAQRTTAKITLQSPCSTLSLAAVRHDAATLPTLDDDIRTCEMSAKDQKYQVLELSGVPDMDSVWYVVVEGRGEEEGPFSLHVECP